MDPMSSEFLYQMEPAREAMVDDPTEEESARIQEHFQYLKSLAEQGVVVLAGRTTERPFTGLVVIRAADRAEAEALMDRDPAIRAGVFRGRMSPFRIALLLGQ